MNRYNHPGKPAFPPLRATRLLDQVRERIRYLHYSIRTEKTYCYWVRWYVRFHGLRHPKDMGGPEVEEFLTFIATERRAFAVTHKQALSALLLLYKQVIGVELPWMQDRIRLTASTSMQDSAIGNRTPRF